MTSVTTTLPLLNDAADGVACCAPLSASPLPAEAAATLAKAFAALGDPVRLRLMSLLMTADGGEVCACDLVEPVGKSQPTVSHHLKVLRDAGLVTANPSGHEHLVRRGPRTGRRAARRPGAGPVTPKVATVRRATADDAPAVRALVAGAGLPLAGLDSAWATFVALDGEDVVGTAALERHGPSTEPRRLPPSVRRRGARPTAAPASDAPSSPKPSPRPTTRWRRALPPSACSPRPRTATSTASGSDRWTARSYLPLSTPPPSWPARARPRRGRTAGVDSASLGTAGSENRLTGGRLGLTIRGQAARAVPSPDPEDRPMATFAPMTTRCPTSQPPRTRSVTFDAP